MLKQIELSELEMGMFVHKMIGSWFDHPFWKANFLIQDEGKLSTLQSSKLSGVVIDTSRGKDSAMPGNCTGGRSANGERPSAAGRAGTLQTRKSVAPARIDPVSTSQEVFMAQSLAANAEKCVSRAFLAARLGKAVNVRSVEPVVRDIYDSVRRNPHAFGGLMRCKLNSEFVYRHALAVSALMVSLARKMKLSETEIYEAGLSGLLLDMGANYMPKGLMPANGDYRTLDPKVWEQHVQLGHRALQNEGGIADAVLETCLQHHERMDGTGYPQGLSADSISLGARMAAICDTFDLLLTKGATHRALDPAAAVQRLTEMEGAFDEDVLRHFIESVGLYPVGSFVDLSSGRVAMVIDQTRDGKGNPVVQAFYSRVTGCRVRPQKIAVTGDAGVDRITGIADLSDLSLPEEAQLRELIFLGSHSSAGFGGSGWEKG